MRVMLFDRQKKLLALLEALGGDLGAMDFQKLLFLYCQEAGAAPYEFVPYRFGGFSFTSYADKRRLIDRGFLADEERAWRLTAAGRTARGGLGVLGNDVRDFARRHAQLRGDALVAEAYRRHPYYATRSEVSDRVLSGDELARAAIARARPASGKPGLCTIGYEGRSLEGYLNRLIGAGVTLLCDVRRNPLSRKYGFSKNTLARGCEGVGIRYEHLPQLGVDSEARRALNSQADYDALFVAYERDTLLREESSLGTIRQWIDEGMRVALTCFERLPQQCHRHCVADALHGRFGATCSPVHL